MTIREILIYPDEKLREVASPVEFPLTGEVKQIIQDMADTMYDAPGVGLAATQIGVGLRIAITDTDWRSEEVRHGNGGEPVAGRNLKVWINPEFTWRDDGMATWEEGCLSVPEVYEDVDRPAAVRLRWQDMEGETHEADFEGFQAVALQHEFDHLDGILFIDRLSRLKQSMIKKRLKKRKKLQNQ
ncbi:MAG: peptide deformylase [Mariprofundaceae bacterium]|nr:peptide deformylase [Mariprofundaceae bacterium]